MSDTMKDGTPIAERWAETYAGIEYAAQCCDGWIDGEDELAKQLIEELSRAEAERDAAREQLIMAHEEMATVNHLTVENSQLKAKVARLEAPVSDEEWCTHCCAFDENALALYPPYLTRENSDALIAARAKEQP